jgi:hypothetical protein
MEENKNGLYILGVVGIVAIVSMVIMIVNAIQTPTQYLDEQETELLNSDSIMTDNESADAAGQVYLSYNTRRCISRCENAGMSYSGDSGNRCYCA